MAFSLSQLQQVIRETYDSKDRRRGVEGTFMWLTEEIGELATTFNTMSEELEQFVLDLKRAAA